MAHSQETLDERIHRTWIEALLARGHGEIGALLVDASVSVRQNFEPEALVVGLPVSAAAFLESDTASWDLAVDVLSSVVSGNLYDQNGAPLVVGNGRGLVPVETRTMLSDAPDEWREHVREMIVRTKNPNQGVVLEKVAARNQRTPIMYNEMKFASKSEVRIAQELEERGVLFFPNALGVRADTGIDYKDHREADFLIVDDGKCGVLEVSYHPNRYEVDKEKDAWFKTSGILCVEHFTAERCYNDPAEVVDQFLEILAKHK